MVDDGGKVGGSPEFDGLDSLVVGLNNPLNARTVRVGGVPIQSKLVGHLTVDLRPKSKGWEQLVTAHHQRKVIMSLKS